MADFLSLYYYFLYERTNCEIPNCLIFARKSDVRPCIIVLVSSTKALLEFSLEAGVR